MAKKITRKQTVKKTTSKKSTPKSRTPISKKKKIRQMRPVARKNPDGTVSSHKMAWVGDPSKKRKGDFGVFPTITPKKGKKTSTKAKDWKDQTAKEAAKKGELIRVKRRKKAQKLAAGSWKKGKDKREAMKSYRGNKKTARKTTSKKK